MRDPVQAQAVDDLVGAVAVVLVEVEDADALRFARCVQRQGRHHQAVEGAKTAGAAVAGEAKRLGILDFDQHYGDGTDQIIDRLQIDWIVHYSAGEHYGAPSQARRFLSGIAGLVASMKDCDVILYQAGADPHIDDPLGGWLTTAQLAERDWLVFKAAAELGIPVAWNLAGGYQTPLRKVLEIHDGTMRVCVETYLG